MASFSAYYPLLVAHEGGYCNYQLDPGGETYRGIARGQNPQWSGWPTIDAVKRQLNLPAHVPQNQWHLLNNALGSNAPLHAAIERFYEANFWNPLRLNEVRSQSVANQLADHGVNAGIRRPGKMAQYLLVHEFGFALTIDGAVGPQTVHALNAVNPALFYMSLIDMRRAFYSCRAGIAAPNADVAQWYSFFQTQLSLKPNPAMRTFLNSWLGRTNTPFVA